MRRRARRWFWGLSAAAGAALVVLSLAGGLRTSTEEGPSVGRADPSVDGAPVRLRGRGEEPSGAPAATAMPPESESAGTEGFRIRGRVTGPPSFPEGSVVFAVASRSGKDRYVAVASPGSGGRFDLEVPALDGAPPWAVRVEALIAGHSRGAPVSVEGSPGAVLEVDLALPEAGTPLRGRVLDLDGEPVAGLRLGIVKGGGWNVFALEEMPDPTRNDGPRGWDRQLQAAATTDAQGRFVVTGVGDGAYSPASYDDRWWLEPTKDPRVGTFLHPASDEVELRARPAFRLDVAAAVDPVSDDPDGAPPVSAYFEIQGGNSWGIGSFGRKVFVRGGVPDAHLAGFEARLRVDSAYHRAEERALSFRPGSWHQQVEVALVLRPAGEDGTLVITTPLRDSRGKPPGINLMHTWQLGPRSWTGDYLPLEPRAEGVFAARLPAGRRQVQIGADVPARDLITWKTEVEIVAGRETAVVFPSVDWGSLRLVFPPETMDSSVYVSFVRAGGGGFAGSWTGAASRDGFLVPFVPAGSWIVTLTGSAGTGVLRKREVEVPAAGEATVAFPP